VLTEIAMTRTLSEAEARQLISSDKVGRLGCMVDGGPYVVPINYFFDEDSIYSHSMPGLKIDALRKTPRACLQVDEVKDALNWQSVIAFGSFEEISAPEKRSEILGKLLSRFPLLTPVESVLAQDAAPPQSIVFRIRIDRITGVAEG